MRRTTSLLLLCLAVVGTANVRTRVKSVAADDDSPRLPPVPSPNGKLPLKISSLEALQTLARQHSLLLVFYKKTAAHMDKIRATANRLARRNARPTVAIFDAQGMTLPDLADLAVKSFPAVDLFVSGHRKPFHGGLSFDQIQVWLREVVESAPLRRSDISQIDPIDKHYFVYADQDALAKNREHFDLLAKLICPLRIYTGFPLTGVALPAQGASPAVTYRKYRDQVTPLDLRLPIDQLAARILANEFLKEVECDNDSLSIVTEFKIPALIYFEDKGSASSNPTVFAQNYAAVQSAASHKADYLILFRVDINARDRCSVFLRDFLGVTAAPSLRILNMVNEVKRYKFVGKFDREHVEFFLVNYVTGNLKTYRLDQPLRPSETLHGLPLANFSTFRRAKRDLESRVLFYVFDSSVSTLEADVAEIQRLAKKINQPNRYKFYAIDHNKNDIDGYYNNAVPFVFLVLRNGKFLTFEGDRITAAGLLRFMTDTIPELKVKNEMDGEL